MLDATITPQFNGVTRVCLGGLYASTGDLLVESNGKPVTVKSVDAGVIEFVSNASQAYHLHASLSPTTSTGAR